MHVVKNIYMQCNRIQYSTNSCKFKCGRSYLTNGLLVQHIKVKSSYEHMYNITQVHNSYSVSSVSLCL